MERSMLVKIKEYLEQLVRLRSLRARIFLIILLVGVVPSVIMRYGIMENYEAVSYTHLRQPAEAGPSLYLG